ncbi:hypothetical protein QFZ80_002386 [Paenibacillus sp. V4I7]|nr:hypothetical protein [Paenibacillus sp. V4I7]
MLVHWETLEDHTVGFRVLKSIKNGGSCCTISMTHFRWSNIIRCLKSIINGCCGLKCIKRA